MIRTALSTAALLIFSAACQEATRQSPTEAVESAAVAPGDTTASVPEVPASTICAAYRKQLGEARTALAREPGADSLRQNVASFEAVIADACD
ncbi:MAG: hypothetical protein JO040_01960 [Gemmatimonadetes bacterium]|nr:hypothetical protein [Gemmatimonadota bacterium]